MNWRELLNTQWLSSIRKSIIWIIKDPRSKMELRAFQKNIRIAKEVVRQRLYQKLRRNIELTRGSLEKQNLVGQ